MTATKETDNTAVVANRTATAASNQAPDLEFKSSALFGASTNTAGDFVDIVALPQEALSYPKGRESPAPDCGSVNADLDRPPMQWPLCRFTGWETASLSYRRSNRPEDRSIHVQPYPSAPVPRSTKEKVAKRPWARMCANRPGTPRPGNARLGKRLSRVACARPT